MGDATNKTRCTNWHRLQPSIATPNGNSALWRSMTDRGRSAASYTGLTQARTRLELRLSRMREASRKNAEHGVRSKRLINFYDRSQRSYAASQRALTCTDLDP